MIKAILFDCFGVLYPDTYWTMARQKLGDRLAEHERQLHDLIKQVDLGYMTRDELWGGFGEIVGMSKDEVYEDLKKFSGLDTRLLRFIEKNKPHYAFGMISNVGHGFIERIFTEKPASYYFDTIVLSSDVGFVKPDRRIYELAANNLKRTPQECVFIDDIEKNVDGALEVGMQGIHYQSYEDFVQKINTLLNMPDTNE